jgi:hypothetical protein
MYLNKPDPLMQKTVTKLCPVCGKSTYSRDGIHPQCSMVQADEPRKLRLQAERRAKAKLK